MQLHAVVLRGVEPSRSRVVPVAADDLHAAHEAYLAGQEAHRHTKVRRPSLAHSTTFPRPAYMPGPGRDARADTQLLAAEVWWRWREGTQAVKQRRGLPTQASESRMREDSDS